MPSSHGTKSRPHFDVAEFILFPWRHLPSLHMAYKLGKPRGKVSSVLACLQREATQKEIGRRWIFRGLNLIAKSQINLKECVHTTQRHCFRSLSLRSWFILRTCHLLKATWCQGRQLFLCCPPFALPPPIGVSPISCCLRTSLIIISNLILYHHIHWDGRGKREGWTRGGFRLSHKLLQTQEGQKGKDRGDKWPRDALILFSSNILPCSEGEPVPNILLKERLILGIFL